jgi:hypothetical protein
VVVKIPFNNGSLVGQEIQDVIEAFEKGAHLRGWPLHPTLSPVRYSALTTEELAAIVEATREVRCDEARPA